MEKPATYCGASSNHIICENYKFQREPIKMFGEDKIFEDFIWLDINNCSGCISGRTFANIPGLKYLVFSNCDFEELDPGTFETLRNLSALRIIKSKFPLDENTLNGCDKLQNLDVIELEAPISIGIFSKFKKLENLSLEKVSLTIDQQFLVGISTLKYLSISFSNLECTPIKEPINNQNNIKSFRLVHNKLSNFNVEYVLSLPSLENLSLFENCTDAGTVIDYNAFKNLPNLQVIMFPTEIIKKLSLSDFKSLRTVQLDIDDKTASEVDGILKEYKNLSVEWVSNTSWKEVDLRDPNIQICS